MDSWSAEGLLRAHAREAPDATALVAGDTVVTWRELETRVEAAAGAHRAAGIQPGRVIAVPAGDPVAAIVGVLAAIRAGGVAAPLPAGLTHAEREAAGQALAGPVLVQGAAIVILTSGTTGRPRGVVLSGDALAASADAWLQVLLPATGWLLAVGLGHVAGLGILWRAIRQRVPVRVVSPTDPAAQLAALRATPNLSHASLVPAQLTRLLDVAGDAPPPQGFRALPLGGGMVTAALVTRALAAGWPVVPTYGLSEAGSGVTALPTVAAALAPDSAGWPLPGVMVSIDTPDADGIGEILVTSPAAFSGYLGEPPRAAGEPIRTGDLGRLDEAGRLVVIDRRTDRIVRGGENISPAEVEAALLSHHAVAAAAVVAAPDALWGQVPLAAVVIRPGTRDLGDPALAAHCRSRLAGFKVPATFLRLDALPRTRGGKLRREAVRALVDGSRSGVLARPDGDQIGWRVTGAGRAGALPLILLPGTLSTAAQLERLAGELARAGDITVHAIDRRGSGSGRRADTGPLDVATHAHDLAAYLDAREIRAAAVVGSSFGGVLALELAARQPGRIRAVIAYEPPYGPLADAATQARFAGTAARTAAAHAAGGSAAAAQAFIRAVSGDAAWDSMSERSRASIAREGDGALADSGLAGLDPGGLSRITAPALILTGGASHAFYGPIAQALVALIPAARHATLDGLTHNAPITDVQPIAAAIRAFLSGAGLLAAPDPGAIAPVETAP